MRKAPRITGMLAVVALIALPSCAKNRPPKDKFAGMSSVEIYQIAQHQLEKKKYAKARDTLQGTLGRTDTTPELVADVHLALADAYFYDGGLLKLAEALSRYTNFLTFYPNHPRADYAQYQLGLCYLEQTLNPDRDQTQTRKALAELIKVESRYPNSEYVDVAYEKVGKARELLAEHDFRIGYFYYKRGSYNGAVERFRGVLEDFPRYSRKDRLYLTLARSLMELEREDEGRLYLQKLVVEFPDSRHADEARILLGEEPVEAAAELR